MTALLAQQYRPHRCQWIFGDPKKWGWRYCGRKNAKPGAPYCTEHMALAYRKVDEERGKETLKPLTFGSAA